MFKCFKYIFRMLTGSSLNCNNFNHLIVNSCMTFSTLKIEKHVRSRNRGKLRIVHSKVLLEVLAEEIPHNTIRFSSNITSLKTQIEQGSSTYIIALDDGTTIKSKVTLINFSYTFFWIELIWQLADFNFLSCNCVFVVHLGCHGMWWRALRCGPWPVGYDCACRSIQGGQRCAGCPCSRRATDLAVASELTNLWTWAGAWCSSSQWRGIVLAFRGQVSS